MRSDKTVGTRILWFVLGCGCVGVAIYAALISPSFFRDSALVMGSAIAIAGLAQLVFGIVCITRALS